LGADESAEGIPLPRLPLQAPAPARSGKLLGETN